MDEHIDIEQRKISHMYRRICVIHNYVVFIKNLVKDLEVPCWDTFLDHYQKWMEVPSMQLDCVVIDDMFIVNKVENDVLISFLDSQINDLKKTRKVILEEISKIPKQLHDQHAVIVVCKKREELESIDDLIYDILSRKMSKFFIINKGYDITTSRCLSKAYLSIKRLNTNIERGNIQGKELLHNFYRGKYCFPSYNDENSHKASIARETLFLAGF